MSVHLLTRHTVGMEMCAWGERWNKTECKRLDLKWLFYIPGSVTWKKEHVWLLPCVIELKGKEKSEDRWNFTQFQESLNSGVEFISFRNRLLFSPLTFISLLWKSIKDSRQMKKVCSRQGIVQGGWCLVFLKDPACHPNNTLNLEQLSVAVITVLTSS